MGPEMDQFLRRRVEMKDVVEGRHELQFSARAVLVS